jgi:hypothetical protein
MLGRGEVYGFPNRRVQLLGLGMRTSAFPKFSWNTLSRFVDSRGVLFGGKVHRTLDATVLG